MIRLINSIMTNAFRLVFRLRKFLVLYWVTNLGFALALSVPMYALIRGNLQHSAINAHITSEFDFLWFLQFMEGNKGFLGIVPPLLYTVTLLYNLIQLFFSGGLLSVAANPRKNHFVDFFFGGVKYFSRFFIVFLVTILLYFVILSTNTLLQQLIVYSFRNYENTVFEFLLHLIRYLLFVFWIGILSVFADYIRTVIVVTDETKILRSIIKAFNFIRNNFTTVFSVYLILASFVAAAAVAYNVADGFIPKTSWALIILTFVIQQMLIIFRLIIRMVFSTSEYFLYNDLNAEVVKPQIEEVN